MEGWFDSETWTFQSKVEVAPVSRPAETSVISSFYNRDLNVARLAINVSMFHDLLKQKGEVAKAL